MTCLRALPEHLAAADVLYALGQMRAPMAALPPPLQVPLSRSSLPHPSPLTPHPSPLTPHSDRPPPLQVRLASRIATHLTHTTHVTHVLYPHPH